MDRIWYHRGVSFFSLLSTCYCDGSLNERLLVGCYVASDKNMILDVPAAIHQQEMYDRVDFLFWSGKRYG